MTAPVTNAETAMVIMILRKNAIRLKQVVEAHKQAYDAHAKLYEAEAEIAKLKAQDKAQKADVRQWLNEAQRQQKIATEAYAKIAKVKELMLEALDFLDSGETYREQYYDEMFELVDKLREAAK